MDLKGMFSRIQHNHAPGGPAEEIFRQYMRGEFDTREYFEATAVSIGHDPEPFLPSPYPIAHPNVREYVIGRLRSDGEFNEVIGKKLGLWVEAMVRMEDFNSSNMTTLLWALDKLREINLPSVKEKIQQTLDKHRDIVFPFDSFRDAIDCQKIDAWHRIKVG